MWIVKVALTRPYTFIILALLLVILGPLAIVNTAEDIFPNIGIPVVVDARSGRASHGEVLIRSCGSRPAGIRKAIGTVGLAPSRG
jgi:hypothetical protein